MIGNLGVALLVWGFEKIIWEIYTKPKKRRAEIAEETNQEVKVEDKLRDIENENSGENEKQDDLLNKALDLVEDATKRSAGDGGGHADKLKKMDDKLVDQLDKKGVAKVIKEKEDWSDLSD